jgi:hypothetical protein
VDGTCAASRTFLAPASCSAGGPPVALSSGSGASTCAGLLAQTSFTWGVCSCANALLSSNSLIDGWNSLKGPYTPGQLGGGIGANGAITAQSNTDIWGQAWAASTATAFTTASMNVHHDVQSGGDVQAGGLNGSRDAHVAGNIGGSMSVARTLYQSPGKTPGGATYGKLVVQPVSVQPPCDCTNNIPVGAMVTYAKTHNDDASVGLDPAILTSAGHPARIDLPCGQYYVTGFSLASAAAVVAHGNTAIFIDGDAIAGAFLTFTIADGSSQLDVFISGTLVASSDAKIGSPSFPASTRVYVGGTQPLDIKSNLVIGGELWAGNAKVIWEATSDMFGAIFAGDFEVRSNFNLHHDLGVVQVGSSCPPPGGGDAGTSPGRGDGASGCGSCKDCGNQACIQGVCTACGSSADCCPPLICQSGTCVPLLP